jgi:hypothetical protein
MCYPRVGSIEFRDDGLQPRVWCECVWVWVLLPHSNIRVWNSSLASRASITAPIIASKKPGLPRLAKASMPSSPAAKDST